MVRIFIIFRQYDGDRMAYRLDEHLRLIFGANNVAMINRLNPGTDARLEIATYVNASQIMLVIIGRGWLSDANLFNPGDPVHLALRTALETPSKTVIPVLVEGAVMPDAAQLPPGLQALAYRTSVNMRDDPDFNMDASRLVSSIQRIEASQVTANQGAANQGAASPPTQSQLRTAPRLVQPRPAPAAPRPRTPRHPGWNPLTGLFNFVGRTITGVFRFIGSLVQVIIHQMLRSTIALVMNIVLMLVIGGLAVMFVSALLNNNFDFGLALSAVIQQLRGLVGL
jgi:hypothetical protein